MFLRFKKRNKGYRFLYYLITGFAIVVFWRGVWGLLDVYLLPDDETLSYTVSVFIGLALLYINDYSLSELAD